MRGASVTIDSMRWLILAVAILSGCASSRLEQRRVAAARSSYDQRVAEINARYDKECGELQRDAEADFERYRETAPDVAWKIRANGVALVENCRDRRSAEIVAAREDRDNAIHAAGAKRRAEAAAIGGAASVWLGSDRRGQVMTKCSYAMDCPIGYDCDRPSGVCLKR